MEPMFRKLILHLHFTKSMKRDNIYKSSLWPRRTYLPNITLTFILGALHHIQPDLATGSAAKVCGPGLRALQMTLREIQGVQAEKTKIITKINTRCKVGILSYNQYLKTSFIDKVPLKVDLTLLISVCCSINIDDLVMIQLNIPYSNIILTNALACFEAVI